MPGVPDTPRRPSNPQLGARVDASLLREMRILAARQDRRLNDLIAEAFRGMIAV